MYKKKLKKSIQLQYVRVRFTQYEIQAFGCPMIPSLYHYKRKCPNTNRIKIVVENRILPPVGIWWKKTIESKSHLDLKFMNFNLKPEP
jgi:hypothetical protein